MGQQQNPVEMLTKRVYKESTSQLVPGVDSPMAPGVINRVILGVGRANRTRHTPETSNPAPTPETSPVGTPHRGDFQSSYGTDCYVCHIYQLEAIWNLTTDFLHCPFKYTKIVNTVVTIRIWY
jgi:hypothetical protein